MKCEIEIADELVAQLRAEGFEPEAFAVPPNQTKVVDPHGRVATAHCLYSPRLILRKLPEPQQAEPWVPGVGKHRTREGNDAEVKFIMGDGSLIGIIHDCTVGELLHVWNPDGRNQDGASSDDLVAPKESEPVVSEPLLEGWVNVYPEERDGALGGRIRRTKEQAERCACGDRLRCVRVREVVEPAEQGGAGL